MKLVIASGKGGVGKSMVSSSLARLFSEKKKIVAVDCDVDAPNLGLWLGVKKFDSEETIATSSKAVINQDKCIKCGKCKEVCRFNSVDEKDNKFEINPFLCEGCNACVVKCPVNAISLKKVENAKIQIKKDVNGFPLVSAQLFPGETGSGEIIAKVRQKAEEFSHDIMILDSSPGIGCPVIASVTNTDFAVLVTEPSVSGLSDLKRVLNTINHFKVPYGIVINQWDVNKEFSEKIEKFAGDKLIGKISFDKKVIDSIVGLKSVLDSGSIVVKELNDIFNIVNNKLEKIRSEKNATSNNN